MTHSPQALRGRWIALCLAAALLARSVVPTSALGSDEALSNGDFASGFEQWVVEGSRGSPAAVRCSGSDCLEIGVPLSGTASARQAVGPLEPGVAYRVEARLRAETQHLVRLSLYDANWEGPYCARKPLSVFVEAAGAGDWQSLGTTWVIPERDPCGPTRDHQWQLRIEFQAHGRGTTSVLLDRVSLVKLAAPRDETERSAAPLCSYFRDYDYTDPCPGDVATSNETAGKPQITTVAKWMLDEGAGALIHDAVAGRNGVVEFVHGGSKPDWRDGALFLAGGPNGARVRVDAGQPIDGKRFEISLEISPAADFAAGCLLATQPAGSHLGGFRLCLSQTTRVLSFEMSQGSSSAEYAAFLSAPIAPGRWTRVRVRGERDVLQVFVGDQPIEEFHVPRLRLRKSPHALVIGADVRAAGKPDTENGFRGKIRNVTLRNAAKVAPPRRGTPLGYVTRGHWPLDEGTGTVVRDRASNQHGLIEDAPNRVPAEWSSDRLHFAGTKASGGVVIRGAGPLYGNDFMIELEALFEDPRGASGSLLVSKTGSSVLGGFGIAYLGATSELVVKLADGTRQVRVQAPVPFDMPTMEWIPIRVRFAHDQLRVFVAQVEIGTFELPDFGLAVAKRAMLVGTYYYPPTRGLRGSIRNVALHMREESIEEDEHELAWTRFTGPLKPCRAVAPGKAISVASDVLLPNWLGATCKRKFRGMSKPRFDYTIDLPRGFKLVASGAIQSTPGKITKNRVQKIAEPVRDGVKYQRYRVELTYRALDGMSAFFGPLFIEAEEQRADPPDGSLLPTMYFRETQREEDAEWSSVALEVREFPKLRRPERLHHSIAWMGLRRSTTWPDFLSNYGKLGFNVVPTFSLYDQSIELSTRRKLMKKARREGFELLVVDSPYHQLIGREEARTEIEPGFPETYVDPSYRGVHYREEVERVATRVAEIEPDWFMMDIECFEDGAFACLVGTSARCNEYLTANAESFGDNREEAVTALGNELLGNIRTAIAAKLPKGRLPRIGTNTSAPGKIYHRLFAFDRLYDGILDYAQPVLYFQSPQVVGRRLREIRAAMPRGDIIPWLDPGTVREFPSEWNYDQTLEVFGAGARGIAWFSFLNLEGADLYYIARAMEAVGPVEDVIVGSHPMEAVEVVDGQVVATGLRNGQHSVLLVSDYRESEKHRVPRRVTLRLPEGAAGTLWDLARRRKLAQVGRGGARELSFEWRPGLENTQTALYYLGPAPLRDDRFEIDFPAAAATRTTEEGRQR